MEMYYCGALRLAIIHGYRRGTRAVDSDSQSATSGSLIVPVRKRIANIADLGKSAHARWPASVEALGQHRMAFSTRVMANHEDKHNCSDVGVLCALGVGSQTTMWIRLYVTLLISNITQLRARDIAARCRKQEA